MSFRKGQSPFFECTFLQIYPQESLTLKNQQWYYTDNTEKWTLYNTEWGETICQSYTMKKQESFISTTRRSAISSRSLTTTTALLWKTPDTQRRFQPSFWICDAWYVTVCFRGKFYILTGEYQAGVSDFRLRRYAFSGIWDRAGERKPCSRVCV